MLYGEFESERRRNMDLTEARDRLADHIKVLSDELGDREVGRSARERHPPASVLQINEEKLLIKSCQQSKLINYMLPQIDCSPVPKKVSDGVPPDGRQHIRAHALETQLGQ